MIRVALVGLGKIGAVHARNISETPGMHIAAVLDPIAERTRSFAERYGARAPASLEELLAAPDLDAVVVASSTDTHSRIAVAAAKSGRAVYCEKPIDLSLEKALAAAVAIKPTGVPVMIGFNRRYDESHAALHQAVKDGSIGRLQVVQMTSRGPNDIPSADYISGSGGIYRDKCIHFFDLLRFITGDEPVEVSAMGGVLADAIFGELGDVDTTIISLRMASGALVQIDNSRRAVYGYDERIEIFGTGGLVESGRTPRLHVMRTAGTGFVAEGLHHDIFGRFGRSYAAAMAAFARFVAGSGERVPTLDDGLAAQLIAEAAVIAARENRTVRIAEVRAR